MNWTPIFLSLQLAFITTILLLIIGTPIAYWLANTRSRLQWIVEAVVSLPLVLPPTVLGFYLLLAFSPNGTVGSFFQDTLGLNLIFSFGGLVVGSVIYSLPFMVHPVHAGLKNLSSGLTEAAYVLGKSKWTTLRCVILPNIKPSLLTGIVLSFAHTIGEFGVVLMIGGNIPGQTRVASIAIYDKVEALDYAAAHEYAAVLVGLCFGILLLRGWWRE